MEPATLALLTAGGGLIGFLLSVLGAGGSILLLPLLVTGAGLSTREAVPLSAARPVRCNTRHDPGDAGSGGQLDRWQLGEGRLPE